MTENFIATSTIVIDAPRDTVWAALIDPAAVRQFMFGSEVVTTWQVGTPILFRGMWEGKPYEDRGEILAVEPGSRLKYTHFSPLGGQPDVPENYHTLSYTLQDELGQTRLSLSQDNNGSIEEMHHSQGMWDQLLKGIKEYVERD
jgi:uncharacterized protein YndB with AHSA1/START domain